MYTQLKPLTDSLIRYSMQNKSFFNKFAQQYYVQESSLPVENDKKSNKENNKQLHKNPRSIDLRLYYCTSTICY